MIRLASKLTLLISSLFLFGCEDPQQKNMGTQNMGMLLGSGETQSENNPFAPVEKGVELTFPADHQAHPNFRHEWWYLTANLIDEDGNPLGVQWTQFRFAAAPPSPPPPRGEDDVKKTEWQTKQIYMAHSAVTTTDKHYADEKWSRDQASLAGVDNSPFRVYLDDWQWTSSTNDLFPATLTANSEQFGYSLTLTSHAPYQKQGEQGYSTKSADGQVASYYYSQPFIDVSGEVTIDGKTHQVSGKGWIDREWSSQFLLDSQQGWDWFALFVMVGIAQACQPILSFNHGAGRPERIDEILKLGVKAAMGSGTVFLLGIWLSAPLIASIYLGNANDLIPIAASALTFYFFGVPLMGLNMVIANLFQAIAKPKQATLISLCRGFVFVALGVLLLPKFFPQDGIWASIVFAETLTAVISLSMLLNYKRKALLPAYS